MKIRTGTAQGSTLSLAMDLLSILGTLWDLTIDTVARVIRELKTRAITTHVLGARSCRSRQRMLHRGGLSTPEACPWPPNPGARRTLRTLLQSLDEVGMA